MVFKNINDFILICMAVFLMAACSSDKSEQKGDAADRGASETTSAVTDDRSKRAVTDGTLGAIPDYEFETLDGNLIKISDYEGKVVMLNFWATWCGPCRREIPELIRLKEKYEDRGFEIIGIALDEQGFDVVRPFINQFDINYKIVVDDYSYGNELGGIYMVPTTYIVNAEGKIAFRKIGEITMEDIEPRLLDLL
ncbi:MAG: TlpA family protein disulfide reductase [Balneolaceae bacterium]